MADFGIWWVLWILLFLVNLSGGGLCKIPYDAYVENTPLIFFVIFFVIFSWIFFCDLFFCLRGKMLGLDFSQNLSQNYIRTAKGTDVRESHSAKSNRIDCVHSSHNIHNQHTAMTTQSKIKPTKIANEDFCSIANPEK